MSKINQNKEKEIKCPYCGKKAEWVENKEIYGKNYGKSYMMYLCKPCDAYVGCHQNTRKPLGTLANKNLREWRKKVHAKIDPLWKNGELKRGQVYARLKKILGYEFHAGSSTIRSCDKVLHINLLEVQ